jgi:hypothetical protein
VKGTIERYKRKYLRDLRKDEDAARAGFDEAVGERQAEKRITAIGKSNEDNPPPARRTRYPWEEVQRFVVHGREALGWNYPQTVKAVKEKYGYCRKWFDDYFLPWSTKSDK